VRGVILVSLENASFHMVHVYTINWFKKVQNINYCSHAAQPTFNCHKRGAILRDYRPLAILRDYRPFGLLAPKDLNYLAFQFFTISVPDEGYSRN
jgi:hypothetical protein